MPASVDQSRDWQILYLEKTDQTSVYGQPSCCLEPCIVHGVEALKAMAGLSACSCALSLAQSHGPQVPREGVTHIILFSLQVR